MPMKTDYRCLVLVCVSRLGYVIYKRTTPTTHFLAMFTIWIHNKT